MKTLYGELDTAASQHIIQLSADACFHWRWCVIACDQANWFLRVLKPAEPDPSKIGVRSLAVHRWRLTERAQVVEEGRCDELLGVRNGYCDSAIKTITGGRARRPALSCAEGSR